MESRGACCPPEGTREVELRIRASWAIKGQQGHSRAPKTDLEAPDGEVDLVILGRGRVTARIRIRVMARVRYVRY